MGALRAKVERLESEMDAIEAENKEVRRLLNQGRGAIWVLGLAAAAAGYAITQWRSIADMFK